jgi:hypothetical protein
MNLARSEVRQEFQEDHENNRTTYLHHQLCRDRPERYRPVQQCIKSISLNPDTAIKTALVIADEERKLLKQTALAAGRSKLRVLIHKWKFVYSINKKS